MSDTTFPTGSSNPLVSRLDRLDFLMKYLERRTKFEGLENDNITNSSLYGGVVAERNGCVPMDLALKEVQVKAPLVDRVAALECRPFQVKRILQICSDMESSSTPHASSSGTCSQTSGDTFYSHRSRGESSCSLPTFNFPNPKSNPNHGNARISHVHVMGTTQEIEENTDIEKQNHPNPQKQKLKKNKPKKDGKSSKSKKKRFPRWPHFGLLGCS